MRENEWQHASDCTMTEDANLYRRFVYPLHNLYAMMLSFIAIKFLNLVEVLR